MRSILRTVQVSPAEKSSNVFKNKIFLFTLFLQGGGPLFEGHERGCGCQPQGDPSLYIIKEKVSRITDCPKAHTKESRLF